MILLIPYFLIGMASHPIPVPIPEHIQPVKSVQQQRWNEAKIRPQWSLKADKVVYLYVRSKSRYDAIQAMVEAGVPSSVVFCIHYRESDNDFSTHLANGDPLTHRTYHVPKGRIPNIDPPYTFEQGASDAIYKVDRLDLVNWQDTSKALDGIEAYNGLGYRKRELPSPYLFSGTTVYERGKYVQDGRFDPLAVDAQLGAVAILKRMIEQGIKIPFTQ